MSSFDEYYKIYEEPEGESLFKKPLLPAYSRESAETFYNHYYETARHIFSFNDDRILIIHGALLIESSIDDLLSDIMVKYKKYKDDDFKFSLKIKMAKAFSIIPSNLFTYADNIRKTRNDFAHNVNLKDFSAVPDRVSKARQHLKNMLKEDINGMSATKVFETLILHISAGIQVFRPGLQLLNHTIRTPEFLEELQENAINLDKLGG